MDPGCIDAARGHPLADNAVGIEVAHDQEAAMLTTTTQGCLLQNNVILLSEKRLEHFSARTSK